MADPMLDRPHERRFRPRRSSSRAVVDRLILAVTVLWFAAVTLTALWMFLDGLDAVARDWGGGAMIGLMIAISVTEAFWTGPYLAVLALLLAIRNVTPPDVLVALEGGASPAPPTSPPIFPPLPAVDAEPEDGSEEIDFRVQWRCPKCGKLYSVPADLRPDRCPKCARRTPRPAK